ncbi:helix-turn-helix transcriptional regulator [Enterobacter quasiroggenkampii]|uniref:helix-turn-helix transcriptional regulator n=1 Tax=Enterobacter quasiroggenkampii TaxID=2497436 RepID=UPI0021CF11AD|nr:helix-turn-helix transcriptional regulator [Enterobacter quasiroggenkampii]MCU6278871.1 helix-turn-helix transcriptional regulator [Enterobacter quasiroggenkampii]MCU6401179.1 helix-turn-helix transcriptional regulator [Enterobacter quasiroggenkampii]
MKLSERLKIAREKAGLSQEQLAHLVDIDTVNSRSRISNYESGRYAPPLAFVLKVARALDYPEGYFYTEDDKFAERILLLYRNRDNPEYNPYQLAVAESERLSSLLDEARDLAGKLNTCLNKK